MLLKDSWELDRRGPRRPWREGPIPPSRLPSDWLSRDSGKGWGRIVQTWPRGKLDSLPGGGCTVLTGGGCVLGGPMLCVEWLGGLLVIDEEPPPQSESSMFPPLLQPAPQPFCNLLQLLMNQSEMFLRLMGPPQTERSWAWAPA